MATSTVRRVFEEGTFVRFKGKLYQVTERNNSYGYNIYQLTSLDNGEKQQAFSYQLDDATEEGQDLFAEYGEEEVNFELELEEEGENAPEQDDQQEKQDSKFKPRFSIITEEEKKAFTLEQKNMNTVRKTNYDMKIVKEFLAFKNEGRSLEEIEAKELNTLLEDYFICVRKSDGSQYEPATLRGMLSSLQRYLQEKKYSENLITSSKFSGMREILTSKYKVRDSIFFLFSLIKCI